MSFSEIQNLLGKDSEYLLSHTCNTILKNQIHQPSKNSVDEIFGISDRPTKVLKNLKRLYGHGRLKNTGYLSILPVDQGIEHSAGATFCKNSDYFDPENIIKLAIEGGCNAVASTFGVLGMMSKKYADKIPFIVKINHNELLSYPNIHDQILFGNVKQAHEMGAIGIGATIYFGSQESRRQIQEISQAFYEAHQLGMFTILWCYIRNTAFKSNKDYHFSADLTGQANHLGVTIQADIIKQKMPLLNGGYKAVQRATGSQYGKFDEIMYTELSSDHPIDLCRYQVANNYMGRIGLINSGGESAKNDIQEATKLAVINKRAGGIGLIMGRKAFQKPINEGIQILNTVQNVYLCNEIDLA